jgi:hypothetical protein
MKVEQIRDRAQWRDGLCWFPLSRYFGGIRALLKVRSDEEKIMLMTSQQILQSQTLRILTIFDMLEIVFLIYKKQTC